MLGFRALTDRVQDAEILAFVATVTQRLFSGGGSPAGASDLPVGWATVLSDFKS
jgi:hypothetical protein